MWDWVQCLLCPSWKERHLTTTMLSQHMHDGNSCQPALHYMWRTYHTLVVQHIFHNAHPVLLISLFLFTHLTATTLSTSFPVSCKELLPKQSPLTSADFKRQKYDAGCFRQVQHFSDLWLFCLLNKCSTLLSYDIKLLDFLIWQKYFS